MSKGEDMLRRLIADELRKWTPQIDGYKLLRPCDEKKLLAIADCIDVRHKRAVRDAYVKGRDDGSGAFCKDSYERVIADALGCDVADVERDADLMALVWRCQALAGDE